MAISYSQCGNKPALFLDLATAKVPKLWRVSALTASSQKEVWCLESHVGAGQLISSAYFTDSATSRSPRTSSKTLDRRVVIVVVF